MLRLIALQRVRALKNVAHLQHRKNIMYRDQSRIVELDKIQQIKQSYQGTQHKHIYSLYIGSLCYIAFPMARFTCIMTSPVVVKS